MQRNQQPNGRYYLLSYYLQSFFSGTSTSSSSAITAATASSAAASAAAVAAAATTSSSSVVTSEEQHTSLTVDSQIVADMQVPIPALQAENREVMGLVTAENYYPDAIRRIMLEGVGPYLSTRDKINLVSSCHYFSIFQPALTKQVVQNLLQAVIDDKVEIVKKLLDKRPALLFAALDENLVIESPYTWQRFNLKNTNALKIAAKRKQLGMIELLLSYCDKLEQTDAMQADKANALCAWTPYQIETNAQGAEEIVIPPAYKDYIQSLVNACVAETFPYGTGTPADPDYTHLSDETEANLSFLFNLLLPKNAVPLDDEYVDVELLLLAAYKAYADNFDAFHNWEQRDVFCIRVIGLIITALPPEMGKIFCEGFYYMVTEKNRKISERAQSLVVLEGGHPFYRASLDSRTGAGFKYLCGGAGRRSNVAGFFKLCASKDKKFLGVMQKALHQHDLHTVQHEPSSGCVIS